MATTLKGGGNYRLNVRRMHRSRSTGRPQSTTAIPPRLSATCSGPSLLPEFGLQKNADGSVDLYFAPKAPVGKDCNWVPTDPNGKFEVLFRFYGPKKPLFEQSVGAAGYQRLN